MHIGLIGGIGPAATDFYYRRLITTFARKNAPLELTIVHADTPTLLNNLSKNDAAAQTLPRSSVPSSMRRAISCSKTLVRRPSCLVAPIWL